MRRPLSLLIGLRFSIAKKHNFILSFVSLASMLGISFGVLVLIVATSVINGSINVMRTEALKSVPHAVLQGDSLLNAQVQDISQVSELEGIESVAPFIEGEAIVRNQGNLEFIKVRGVDPQNEYKVLETTNERYFEVLRELGNTDQGIILGTRLASELGIFNSKALEAIPLGSLLRRSSMDVKTFKVIGFADFGIYGNSNLALINLKDAQEFFDKESGAQLQLRLKVEDIFRAKSIAEHAKKVFPSVRVVSWDEAQASLFTALNLEKILTSIMLIMIVVIGAVNIISTLVMIVSDKSPEIAILRTIGATRLTVMKIFVVQGMISGVLGTIFGVILGTILALHASSISQVIESVINQVMVDGGIYFISHLRTEVKYYEVFVISSIAMLISFFATLYPAYRASKIYPAEVLRYE